MIFRILYFILGTLFAFMYINHYEKENRHSNSVLEYQEKRERDSMMCIFATAIIFIWPFVVPVWLYGYLKTRYK